MNKPAPKITPDLVAEHGLSSDEYGLLAAVLGREPTLTELGIFSVMWSEHCSYKSSRVHLKKLPTKGPQVIQGPGENAGVVDIGDGQAAIFKMESHNHPSYIEPYQGAATGVGGILRDVFTMGARPIANMNALRFGEPDHPKTRHLVAGVVAGIGGYGNCVGVPTVGGEINFHARYNGNILVNAMTRRPRRRRARSSIPRPKGVGNPVVYVGSKTGRDGIHGATMASAEFDEAVGREAPDRAGRRSVHREAADRGLPRADGEDAIVAIQDMGAAGLTSSSVEMATRAASASSSTSTRCRSAKTGMTAYEMMLSESQERMLMVLKPGREADRRGDLPQMGARFRGDRRTTDTGQLRGQAHGGAVRPTFRSRRWPTMRRSMSGPGSPSAAAGAGQRRGRAGAEQRCSALLEADGLARPGLAPLDLGAIRPHGHGRHGAAPGRRRRGRARPRHRQGAGHHLRLTPRYCAADPFEGGKQAVAEALAQS